MTEIKGIRKKLGFSRHALALILDWELATVIRYEHGVLIKLKHDQQLEKINSNPDFTYQLFAENRNELPPIEAKRIDDHFKALR